MADPYLIWNFVHAFQWISRWLDERAYYTKTKMCFSYMLAAFVLPNFQLCFCPPSCHCTRRQTIPLPSLLVVRKIHFLSVFFSVLYVFRHVPLFLSVSLHVPLFLSIFLFFSTVLLFPYPTVLRSSRLARLSPNPIHPLFLSLSHRYFSSSSSSSSALVQRATPLSFECVKLRGPVHNMKSHQLQ